MERIMKTALAALFAASLAAPAMAACADEETAGISKDGSTAPLEESVGSEETAGIAKDGSTAPLEESAGNAADEEMTTGSVSKDGKEAPMDAEADTAMSDQDVEAQQQGEDTAMAEAEAGAEDCVDPS